jgi:poly(A)-specific ribonuclease
LKQFNSLVAKQTGKPYLSSNIMPQLTFSGLRFVFEALAGGDLTAIDPEWFCVKGSEKPEDQLAHAEWELTAVREALRIKKQVIVGHNLFTDLGFLYATFVGTLPYSVTHFQEDIHEFFPRVIDTKYLATYGADATNPRTNLKELLAPFRKIHVPLIVLHEEHMAYGASFGKEHEAGFDSLFLSSF